MKHLSVFITAVLMMAFSNQAFSQQTFDFTGAAQTYDVPNDVNLLKVETWGAQGGGSEACDTNENQDDGGLGGYAVGYLMVTPGETLNVYVGGKPGQVNGSGSPGGFNGGGVGGLYGGAGGGASDIRMGGSALEDRVVVAGGGGGGNTGCPDHGTGGAGGALVGGDGLTFLNRVPGLGGTQMAGGAAGDSPGTAGTLGQGGGTSGDDFHIGGGGGGYYGGGGAYAAGGGGGSSYIDGLLNGSTEGGVNTGNGKVVITALDPYEFTGTPQVYEVPEGVTYVKMETWGAQGGDSEACNVAENQSDGGLGGYAAGYLSVTPGELLYVYVGEKPGQVNGTFSAGGYNGGGLGGQYGGAGGGATDIRRGATALTDRIIVAGAGGGGNTGCPDHGTGGGGGALVGGDGITFLNRVPGLGGTQMAGGAAGDSPGEAGTLGQGGGSSGSEYHIGGGGGGYYGGGSAYAAGGGGGSSYIDGLDDAETIGAVNTGDGFALITPVDLIFEDGFE